SVPYSQTITASGGASPYRFVLLTGSLPPGLTLSSAGVLSGTPTTPGTFGFMIQATDAAGCSGALSYSVAIAACNVTIAPPTLPGGSVGVAYSQMLIASGGAAPYNFAVTAGAPPLGLALSSAGLLSGT